MRRREYFSVMLSGADIHFFIFFFLLYYVMVVYCKAVFFLSIPYYRPISL